MSYFVQVKTSQMGNGFLPGWVKTLLWTLLALSILTCFIFLIFWATQSFMFAPSSPDRPIISER